MLARQQALNERYLQVWWLEQRVWWIERLLLSRHTALAPRTRPNWLDALEHGFFGIIQKIAKRTQHVYARCQDGSLDEE